MDGYIGLFQIIMNLTDIDLKCSIAIAIYRYLKNIGKFGTLGILEKNLENSLTFRVVKNVKAVF